MRYAFRRIACCNMCGGESFKMLGMRLSASQGLSPRFAEGIAVPVKRCRRCGLVFADPQPVPDSLSDHYGLPPEGYWSTEQFNWTSDYFSRELKDAQDLLRFKPGMKALDIGVGLGKAMTSLNHGGFDTWGIEPSARFREKAISLMDLAPDRVLHAAVEEAEFPENQFDFITFGAVLEHLYDPSAALSRALHWLRPGGIIQAEVPSSDHLISKLVNFFFRLRGTNYVTNISPMHPPYHLHEFTLKSFQENAQRLGYEIARHRYSVCSIYHLPKILHPPLRWWMDKTRTGMQLTVYLKRPLS